MIKSKSPADLCLNKWTRFFFISLIHNPKITCNILTKAVPSTSYENLERMSRKHGHQGAQLHFEETLRSCFHSSKVRLIREGFVHNTEFMDICHIWRSEEQRKTHELYKKKGGGCYHSPHDYLVSFSILPAISFPPPSVRHDVTLHRNHLWRYQHVEKFIHG